MTLEEAIKHAEEVADLCEYVACQEGKCAEEHRQLAEWLKELKQLREQTRWIHTSERLPEKYKEVLTCSLRGFIEIQDMGSNYWEDQYGDLSDIDEVIAWMPLPEPYNAEKGGE